MIDPAGLRARARVLRAVRRWFDDHGYLELQTPLLVPSPAMEEYLYPVAAEEGWLRTSPEFALKRAVAAGLHRVYEIGPCFRGRERGAWHGREFTMVEWYRVGAELGDLMDDVEAIVACAAEALDRPAPRAWRRATMQELFLELTGIDLVQASASDLSPREPTWDDAFFRRWVEDVEPRLEGALFLQDWPASQAALARIRRARTPSGEWPVACRFEAFLDGVELANAYFELTDAEEQRQRFTSANAARLAAGEAPHPEDPVFVEAVGRMPRTAGIALGLDRLVAVLCGWEGISRGRIDHPADRWAPLPT